MDKLPNNGFIRSHSPRFNVKLISFIALLIVLFGLPIIVFLTKNQQQTQQQAYIVASDHDSCSKLTIKLTENPIDPSGGSTTCLRLAASSDGNNTCTIPDPSQKNNVSTYNLTIQISSNNGKSHTIQYSTFNNFCTHGYGDLFGTNKDCHCNDNDIQKSVANFFIPTTGSKSISMSRSPTIGVNCGTYQFDFIITSIDGDTTCTYGTAEAHPGGVGHCETGIDCTITPIPSATPTLTVTPPTTPSPTVCLTPEAIQNVKVTCPNCSTQ